jgi:hypothetical protein
MPKPEVTILSRKVDRDVLIAICRPKYRAGTARSTFTYHCFTGARCGTG